MAGYNLGDLVFTISLRDADFYSRLTKSKAALDQFVVNAKSLGSAFDRTFLTSGNKIAVWGESARLAANEISYLSENHKKLVSTLSDTAKTGQVLVRSNRDLQKEYMTIGKTIEQMTSKV